MKINISSILYEEGKSINIDNELTFPNINLNGVELDSPVKVEGEIFNIGGCIELKANVTAVISYLCDRCLSKSTEVLKFDISERFKKALDNTDDINSDAIVFSGNEIDISDVIADDILINVPSKLLCSNQCLGLCTVCGQNLNIGKCDCDTRVADPRFDILDNFF